MPILDNYKTMGKIIITENQKNTITKTVFKYFDTTYTPDVPWDVAENDIIKHEDEPYEYDLHTDDSGRNYYTYVNCKTIEQSLGKDHEELCPYIDFPYDDWFKLNKLFGPIWKQLFIDWFNTKMKDVKITDVFNMYQDTNELN